MHRLIKRLFTIITLLMVLSLAYALYGRDVVPANWHVFLDPVSFGVIAVFTIWVAGWVYHRHFRYRDLSLEKIDEMDGFDFERFCAYLLKRNGYRHITVTQESGDQGVDIIATKDKVKYGIQCKRYNGFVGNRAVQEVWAGHQYYELDGAIVLTNSTFSDSAQELADELGVQLIDRDGFRKMLRRLPS
ncbi:restriction endonuclease [Lacticaseibacillus hulanensis]|uniref:restriction endonuclease n=1 Tax=Lacticaseibacillus hulanensis TaxID=2493111 RepID=UPI000FD803E0